MHNPLFYPLAIKGVLCHTVCMDIILKKNVDKDLLVAFHAVISSFVVLLSITLIAYKLGMTGVPGRKRQLLFILSVLFAAWPYEKAAWRGEKKALAVHTLCAFFMSLAASMLSMANLAKFRTPGKFRALWLIASLAWLCAPALKRAMKGDKKAMLVHYASSGALLLWSLVVCVTKVAFTGRVGYFRLMLFAASFVWFLSVPYLNSKNNAVQ